MKNLGKKAVHGTPGKAASMKKAVHGALGKAAVPVNKTAQEKKKEADVPGEWLYLAPETVGVRQIADVLEGTCEMEIWQAYLRLCTAEKPPWTWRKGKSIPGIR